MYTTIILCKYCYSTCAIEMYGKNCIMLFSDINNYFEIDSDVFPLTAEVIASQKKYYPMYSLNDNRNIT